MSGWRRALVLLTTVTALVGTIGYLGAAKPVMAAVPPYPVPSFSAPWWYPLRGASVIGCTYGSTSGRANGYAGNCTVNKVAYHSWPALDLASDPSGASFGAAMPIYAAAPGIVMRVTNPTFAICGGLARSVEVFHGKKGSKYVSSYYTHMISVNTALSEGDPVTTSTVLGYVGDTGDSDCGFHHLHFEQREYAKLDAKNLPTGVGSPVAPGKLYVCANGTVDQVPAESSWDKTPLWEQVTNDGPSCDVPKVPSATISAVAGLYFTASYQVADAVAPFTVSATSGKPAWVTTVLNARTLTVSGTAPQPGNSTFTVTIRSANGRTGTGTFTVQAAAPVPFVAPADQTVRVRQHSSFSAAFTFSGGYAPFTTVAVAPSWMNFQTDETTRTVTVTGTPPSPGTTIVGFNSSDALRRSVSFTLTVNAFVDVPPNTIIRRAGDNASWVVDASMVRHYIPYPQDDVCWRDLRGLTVSATGLSYGDAATLEETDAWPCIIGNRVVQSGDGSSWYVDQANQKHWIPDTDTFSQQAALYPVVGPWPADDVNTLPSGADIPLANVANTIICRSDGICWAVDGNSHRHVIPSYAANVCWRWVNGWHISKSGLSYAQANTLPEDGPWDCNMNGYIFATNEGAAYYMDGNVRRWIREGYDFECYQREHIVRRGIGIAELGPVTEGDWMPPKGCDGLRIYGIWSRQAGRYVSAELGYGGADYGMLRARSGGIGEWEMFRTIGNCSVQCTIESIGNRMLVSAELGYQGFAWGEMRARQPLSSPGGWEQFHIDGDCTRTCALKALGSGMYVSTEMDYTGAGQNMLRARSGSWSGWESYNLTLVS